MEKKRKIILVAGARPNFMNPVRDCARVRGIDRSLWKRDVSRVIFLLICLCTDTQACPISNGVNPVRD